MLSSHDTSTRIPSQISSLPTTAIGFQVNGFVTTYSNWRICKISASKSQRYPNLSSTIYQSAPDLQPNNQTWLYLHTQSGNFENFSRTSTFCSTCDWSLEETGTFWSRNFCPWRQILCKRSMGLHRRNVKVISAHFIFSYVICIYD